MFYIDFLIGSFFRKKIDEFNLLIIGFIMIMVS